MSRHCYILFRPTACLALVFFAAFAAPARAAMIEDTFTRADNTILGTTEVGGFSYVEASTTNAATVNSVDVFSNELRVFGETATPATPTSNPGIALIGANLADISIAADMRYTYPNGTIPTNSGTNNFCGFVLRKNGPLSGTGIPNEGLIEVELQAGGGLFIREVKNGALNLLFQGNTFGLGGTSNNAYSAAGQLPTTFNSLPFDANGNGRLDANEPFRLSADLIGNSLSIGVNGLQIKNVTTTASAPAQALSYAGLYKNRFTSAGGNDISTPVFDNLIINGTPHPLAPIIHTGNMNPASSVGGVERWATVLGTVAPANNGPVIDAGTPAWNIRDTSAASGSTANYQRALTPEQGNAARTLGWSMKSQLRVVSVIGTADTLDGSIELSAFPDSLVGYTLWLGADTSGNAVVGEFGGTGTPAVGRTVTVGAGYHDFEMIYNAGTLQADLFVDGSLALSNLLALTRTAASGALNRILWGSNASAGQGEANYASVQFTVVPEPSSMVLLLMAISFGIVLRRKDG